jgi:hypothetical protein
MKVRLTMCGVGAATITVMLCLLFVSMTPAQNSAPDTDRRNVIQEAVKLPKTAKTPRTPDGHPDLSGFYLAIGDMPEIERQADGSLLYEHHSYGQDEAGVAKEVTSVNPPPYKPEYLAKAKELVKDAYGGSVAADPMQACVPMGGSTPRRQWCHAGCSK